jgi:hypothetical protein
MLLAMAGETRAHIMSDGAFGKACFCEISMACGTGDSSRIVRSMSELHMCFGRKAVNPYPRDLNVLIRIGDNFLNLRFLLEERCVAQHAFSDRWNTGCSAMISANMAVETI